MGSKGFERADAVLLASFLGYSVYAGRLFAGYLLDFIWAPAIACAPSSPASCETGAHSHSISNKRQTKVTPHPLGCRLSARVTR